MLDEAAALLAGGLLVEPDAVLGALGGALDDELCVVPGELLLDVVVGELEDEVDVVRGGVTVVVLVSGSMYC